MAVFSTCWKFLIPGDSKIESHHPFNKTVWILLVITLCYLLLPFGRVDSVRLYGRSHVTYPKWDACINASIYFEFQTNQENGLLLYVDDGGRFDFIQIVLSAGEVKVVLNIVDGRDGNVRLGVNKDVSDGKWHSVELRRNRMQTILTVDGESQVAFSHGSDFHFGAPQNNSYVYIGGLPRWYDLDLSKLALPSVLGQNHFQGTIRNVLYSNCTCETVRAQMISGEGIDNDPPESCESDSDKKVCSDGCVCMSSDAGSKCDCTLEECAIGRCTDCLLLSTTSSI